MFERVDDAQGEPVWVLTDQTWTNFVSSELTWVDGAAATLVAGRLNMTQKGKLRIQFDPDSYYAALGSAADEPEGPIVVVQDKVHPKSMEGVLRSLPEFQRPVKSVLQLLIEGAGHLLILSPKYHAELAGVGIEYCFGRVKWWFRNKNTMSTQSLKEKSRMSFGPDVVAIDHARKFAWRARDYVRAYMWGATGLEVEIKIKLYKTHRSALDTDFKFVSE